MIKGDKQLGKPFIEYGDTKTALESLVGVEGGMIAFATDTKQFGFHNNTSWLWTTSTPTASAIPLSDAAGHLNSWIVAATPTTLAIDSINTEGVSEYFARADHIHAIATSNNPGASASILASSTAGHLTLVQLNTDTISDRSGGNLSIAPTGDVELNPIGAQVRVMASHTLQSDNYASQTTGWGISYAGGADFRYLFADEMHVKSFIADLEQALAGGQIISKSVAMLSRDFTAPAAGAAATLYVRDLPSAENMAVFESGDIVRLRTFSRASGSLTVADCWGVVTAYSDLADKEQSWTFTRSSGGNEGTMAAGTIVATDSLVLDYGTTGNGFYEVNAIDGAYGVNSPYSQVVTWATHPHSGKTVRTRLGNLKGITAVTEYGLYAGEGVSAGDSYLRLTDQNFELHNLDLALYDSGNVQRIGMDAGVGATDKLMWAGTSASDPRFIVYGNGNVWLSTLAISEQMGDILFSQADGLALWGPGCAITPTSWTSTRGQTATISGAFHQEAGPWAQSRALVVEPAATNYIVDPVFGHTTLSDYWTNDGCDTFERVSNSLYTGGAALHIADAGPGYVYSATITNAGAGETWTATARVYCVSGSASLVIQENNGGWSTAASADSAKNGQWETLTATATLSVGVTDARISFEIDGSDCYVDWVQFEQSAYATTLVWGGAGTGYTWNGDGTPHANTSTRAATVVNLDANAPMLSGLNAVTHSVWVQAQYDASNPDWPCGANVAVISDYRGADVNNEVIIAYDPNTSDSFRVYLNNGCRIQVANQTFAAGDWLHLVLSLDYTNDSYKLYLNGTLIGNSTTALTAPTGLTDWILGDNFLANGTCYGGWVFGEYAVLKRILTAEEVAALYARGKPLADAGAMRRPGVYILDGEFDLRSSQTGARVQIDADGVAGYSDATTKTFSLETDGDLFLGSDISAAATTAFAVFATAQTYGTASESMGAGDVLLGDNSAGKINLLWDVSEGDVILRRGTSARITLDGSADSILIGQVAANQNNILISSGAISIRNNNVERIGITAAGILTIKDSGGDAVITLDASAGAEITKTLAMKGASAAISIGETPPTAADAGTGIWIDRTGLYSLDSDDYQVKIDATDGKLYAGGGNTVIGKDGIRYMINTSAIEHIQYIRSFDSAVGGRIYSRHSVGGAINYYSIVFGSSSFDGNIGFQAQGASYVVGFELDSSTDKITASASNIQLGIGSAVKVYIGGSTYYLYISGSDLYWWNGSTGTKLN